MSYLIPLIYSDIWENLAFQRMLHEMNKRVQHAKRWQLSAEESS